MNVRLLCSGLETINQVVVQPSKNGASNQAVNQPPGQADKTADGADIVAPVDRANHGGLPSRAVKKDDPPSAQEQAP